MKAWDVIAICNSGETVCRDCCTAKERRCWDDKEPFGGDITVVFAGGELDADECCSRCGRKLAEDY